MLVKGGLGCNSMLSVRYNVDVILPKDVSNNSSVKNIMKSLS